VRESIIAEMLFRDMPFLSKNAILRWYALRRPLQSCSPLC